MALTAAEQALATVIGFDHEVCETVKQHTGRTFVRLIAFAEDDQLRDTNGLSVAVKRQEIEPLVLKLQADLTSCGYRAFWSQVHRSDGQRKSDELVVLRTSDQYSIIKIRRSSGGNYGVSTDDVIATLKEWENRCRFQIVGAACDWVAIRFKVLPRDVCTFAEEVYEFCPDTVEQGVGLMNERDHPEAFEAAKQLCPALSIEMQRKLEDRDARFKQIELPPQFHELLQSDSFTPTDMGIRLLAHHLKQSNQLFLWWD